MSTPSHGLSTHLKDAIKAEVLVEGGQFLTKMLIDFLKDRGKERIQENLKKFSEHLDETIAALTISSNKYKKGAGAKLEAWLMRIRSGEEREGGGGKYSPGDYFTVIVTLTEAHMHFQEKHEEGLWKALVIKLAGDIPDLERDRIIRLYEDEPFMLLGRKYIELFRSSMAAGENGPFLSFLNFTERVAGKSITKPTTPLSPAPAPVAPTKTWFTLPVITAIVVVVLAIASFLL